MRPNNLKIYKGFLTLWLILLVIAVGVAALIAFGILDVGKIKKSSPSQPAKIVEDQQVQNLQNQSTSDEVGDIEKDLNTTNLNSLDQELPDADKAVGEL